MNPRFTMLAIAGLLALGACAEETTEPANPSSPSLAPSNPSATVGLNVVLKSKLTSAQLAQLSTLGKVKHQFTEINGLTMAARTDQLTAVRALPFVKAAAIDQELDFGPHTDLVPVSDLTSGFSTWNQDAINATVAPLSNARAVSQTGEGVYVGMLDTGLLNTWPQYFPQERIATQYARTFVGGGALDRGAITSPGGDSWEHDKCAHGTATTSEILGFQISGVYFQGTAPKATIIPVQLHSEGSINSPNRPCPFFNSVAAAGLLYFAQLKQGPLAGHPLVVNNSWGAPSPDPLTQAAVDFALDHGVLLVFSAGNSGDAGMDYPGASPQVISAAASGWVEEWTSDTWWFTTDVADPTDPEDFYIAGFSSREKSGQDLDVAAPGTAVPAPFQFQRGRADYFFLPGTSFAAPEVTGTVALMLQKNPALTEAEAESIIESTAVPLGAGCRSVLPGPGTTSPVQFCWGTDATGSGLLDAAAAVAATP